MCKLYLCLSLQEQAVKCQKSLTIAKACCSARTRSLFGLYSCALVYRRLCHCNRNLVSNETWGGNSMTGRNLPVSFPIYRRSTMEGGFQICHACSTISHARSTGSESDSSHVPLRYKILKTPCYLHVITGCFPSTRLPRKVSLPATPDLSRF